MDKLEWMEKLKNDRVNRVGLGMYVLDSFDEEAAELLAEHDRLEREKAINEFSEKCDVYAESIGDCFGWDKKNSESHFLTTEDIKDISERLKNN